jgi:short subunit dehydrogenase-like uncharacterized protein
LQTLLVACVSFTAAWRNAAHLWHDASTMLLIYGANGYTGELIARQCKADRIEAVLAGRSREAIEKLAAELGMPHRVFDLASPELSGASVVLHCAGPFSRTSAPMVDACLAAGAHYLDITGEIDVFEACAARKSDRIMIMPGVGFDVVPTDCMAAHLKRRLPTATHLALGFQGLKQPSHGTALTVVEGLHKGGMVRQDGRIVSVPAAHKTRTIDFGRGPTGAMCIPWGDVSTAWHSTRIPNIEVYMAAPLGQRVGAKLLPAFAPLLKTGPVQRFLHARLARGQAGPSDEQRRRSRSYVWGEASDGSRTVVSRLETPDGYTLTVLTALAIARKVLAGDFKPGYQTPSSAYGADLILEIAGCSRSDEG